MPAQPRKSVSLSTHPRASTSGDEILFTLDPSGNFKFINVAGERLCGYSCEEARAMNVTEILAPQYVGNFPQQLMRNVNRRFGIVYEVEVVTKVGRRVTLEVSVDLVRQNGRLVEIRGLALTRQSGSANGVRPRCLDEQFAFHQLDGVCEAASTRTFDKLPRRDHKSKQFPFIRK